MFQFTFSLDDIPKVLMVVFLECALSADNALVLASLIQPLSSSKERFKALWIGSLSSFILRAIAIVLLAYLVRYRWIQLIGGAYLIYLALFHYLKRNRIPSEIACLSKTSFWAVVIKIECLDCLFAIDSILAALAIVGIVPTVNENYSKLWIVYLGGIIGVIAIRFAAELFSFLMDVFPKIKGGTHMILGWVGLKMLLETTLSYVIINVISLKKYVHLTEIIFWVGLLSIIVITFLPTRKCHHK